MSLLKTDIPGRHGEVAIHSCAPTRGAETEVFATCYTWRSHFRPHDPRRTSKRGNGGGCLVDVCHRCIGVDIELLRRIQLWSEIGLRLPATSDCPHRPSSPGFASSRFCKRQMQDALASPISGMRALSGACTPHRLVPDTRYPERRGFFSWLSASLLLRPLP